MTTPAHGGRMLFVNIPVADIERSKAFFAPDSLVTRQPCLWQSVGAEPKGGAIPMPMLVSAPPGAD